MPAVKEDAAADGFVGDPGLTECVAMCVDGVRYTATLDLEYLDQAPYSKAKCRERANARQSVRVMLSTTSRLLEPLRPVCSPSCEKGQVLRW